MYGQNNSGLNVVIFAIYPSFQTQQVASTDKEMGLFSRGRVHMVVTLDRHGYATGHQLFLSLHVFLYCLSLQFLLTKQLNKLAT